MTDRDVWEMLVPRPFGSFGFFHGKKGVGVYSKVVNSKGDYAVMFYRPAGTGVRAGFPSCYKLVERHTTRRKTKGKAMDRAYFLAHAKSRQVNRPRVPTTNKNAYVGPNR